jgi:LmbE family N-acetylglucosaminyl deacetylase
VAAVIRKYQPDIVLAPYFAIPPGRGLGHNDHWKTGILVSQAFNLAHLRKAPIPGDPHQAKAIYYYYLPPGVRPTFLVDVTPYFDDWSRALQCHKSQFSNPNKPKPKREVMSVVERVETVARSNAWLIGGKYAQAFYSDTPLKIADPLDLVREIEPRP